MHTSILQGNNYTCLCLVNRTIVFPKFKTQTAPSLHQTGALESFIYIPNLTVTLLHIFVTKQSLLPKKLDIPDLHHFSN